MGAEDETDQEKEKKKKVPRPCTSRERTMCDTLHKQPREENQGRLHRLCVEEEEEEREECVCEWERWRKGGGFHNECVGRR